MIPWNFQIQVLLLNFAPPWIEIRPFLSFLQYFAPSGFKPLRNRCYRAYFSSATLASPGKFERRSKHCDYLSMWRNNTFLFRFCATEREFVRGIWWFLSSCWCWKMQSRYRDSVYRRQGRWNRVCSCTPHLLAPFIGEEHLFPAKFGWTLLVCTPTF